MATQSNFLPYYSSNKLVILRTMIVSSVSTKTPICCIQKASSVIFVFLSFNIKLTEYKYILVGFWGIDNKWLNKGKVSCLNYPQNAESFNHLIPQKSKSYAQEMKHWITVYNRHTYPPKTVEMNSPLLHSYLFLDFYRTFMQLLFYSSFCSPINSAPEFGVNIYS